MPSIDHKIDVFTENEELFQRQVEAVLQKGIESFKNISEVEESFENIQFACSSLDIRLEQFYKSVPVEDHPDYSQLAFELNMWRVLLQSQLVSNDYKQIKELLTEAKKIASTDKN